MSRKKLAPSSQSAYRMEHDSLGEIPVPVEALWGAQTQRAVENFEVSQLRMSRQMIRSLGLIKAIAATTNAELHLLDDDVANAISRAGMDVSDGKYDEQFPVDIFQTGSGTSSNMNANEVVAKLASRRLRRKVHPNDHVNLGQSSNDTLPTAIHLAACLLVEEQLKPALVQLRSVIDQKGQQLEGLVKTGRTHLMDALPIRFEQELSGWSQQISNGIARLDATLPRLSRLAQGGTAIGTGVNAHPGFSARFARNLSKHTGLKFRASLNHFESLSCMDAANELSGQLKVIAGSMMKIANDLRWMNSGPLSGLQEISLPVLQPGSSIMPGKVNPVAPEAVCMIAAKVMGNDASIGIAAQSGNFQLNVMLPLIAHSLIESLELLASGAKLLGEKAIAGFTVNQAHIDSALSRNPVLVTALNPVIGYDLGAKIAKQAYRENRPVLEVALEQTDLSEAELRRYLDPAAMTLGGVPKAGRK
tara:strand:+ start:552 stop:1976 length:1425 start_codon:yes stop_codon:yes gene_type:complete